MLHVSDDTFAQEVLQASQPVLVDFYADWCGPCRAIAPIVEEIARELSDRLKVVKLDVDQNPQTAMQYGVQSIPTLTHLQERQGSRTPHRLHEQDQTLEQDRAAFITPPPAPPRRGEGDRMLKHPATSP
jgi:thioredoxin